MRPRANASMEGSAGGASRIEISGACFLVQGRFVLFYCYYIFREGDTRLLVSQLDGRIVGVGKGQGQIVVNMRK